MGGAGHLGCWSNRKSFIEALNELWQKRVARSDITDSSKSEFFYKSVLQSAIHSLHSTFSLAGVGAEDLYVQFGQGTPKLGHARTTFCISIYAEYRVFVGIEGDRSAMCKKISAEGLEIRFRALAGNKLQTALDDLWRRR